MTGPILGRFVLRDFGWVQLVRSVTVGMLSRVKFLVSRRSREPGQAARRFFEDARGKEKQYEIIDMGQGIYQGFLEALPAKVPIYLSSDARVLELGCGDLNFLHHLVRANAPPSRYLGLDVVPPSEKAKEILKSEWTFQAVDLEHVQIDCPFKPNLVIACNTVCYLGRPLRVIRQAADKLSEGGFFLIFDPVPSIFWETYFRPHRSGEGTARWPLSLIAQLLGGWRTGREGVHLHLRPLGTFNSELEGANLRHEGDYLLHAIQVAGKPRWPIAYLSVFAKQAS
jgi:SAM-dependent methyltransferase